MKKVAIVGVGPTGIYTFQALVNGGEPLSIVLYEQAEEAGVGMPYSDESNTTQMLANIASIEIPPIDISYLTWLQNQSEARLTRYGIEREALHERQFLPRVILGDYYRDRFLALLEKAKQSGCEVNVRESCEVTDLKAEQNGVKLWINHAPDAEYADFAVIATGHLWPQDDAAPREYYPSPWTGLMQAQVAPCRVGIMGTSLSGIDAAVAVVSQHGSFKTDTDDNVHFHLDPASQGLSITLMSRNGILPEADFYCPIPYEPLRVVSDQALEQAIALGSAGLLDRVFQLIVTELELNAPQWCQQIALRQLTADTFSDSWFASRKQHDPFSWAQANLHQVERNKRRQHTVAWRYTILRLHEMIETIVPHLDEHDSTRFKQGLARVFIDNYAAIPSESIRRLLALREAGVIQILPLGNDYQLEAKAESTVIKHHNQHSEFDVFIDARGQKALKSKDLPFPTLREQLLACGDEIPDIGDDYTLQAPDNARGRIAFGALPWLMHDRPFVQGLTASAEIGAAMARAVTQQTNGRRRKLWFSSDW